MSSPVPTAGKIRTGLVEWGPVVLLALIPALPLLVGTGLVNTRAGGDSPFLLVRVEQLARSLRAGVFPVRWMPQAAYGLGYPLFGFYASLPYYLAAVLKLLGLGYITSIKLTQAVGFVFAAAAAYGYSRELFHRRAVSLLTAWVYSCAPFHMVNVYVRGDSLSEFYAFVFFPLILWSLLRLHRQPTARNTAWVALSYAGLVLTHNISALTFSPFALLYAVWLALSSTDRLRNMVRNLSALAGGALASAWFWLPALAERGNVYLKDMTTGYFNYALHFRSLDLVQRSLAFDYSISANTQPFSMGLAQAGLATAGLIAVLAWWIRQRRIEGHSALTVLLFAASTFMITPLSRPLWDHLPLLPMVQFPWRFLSLQAIAASLLAAYLVPRNRQGVLVALLLGTLILCVTFTGLHPERLFIGDADVTAERLMLYELFTANIGTTIRADYLPRWVDPRPYTSEAAWQGTAPATQGQQKPAPLVVEGQVASSEFTALGPESEKWAIEVTSSESLLAFHTYYYPGWEARVDGRAARVEVLPGLGYLGLRLGQGRHEVILHLGRTPVQRIAEVASALALVVLLSILIPKTRIAWRSLVAVVVVLIAVAALAAGLRALSPRESPEQRLDLTMDFDRVPYLHHNPDQVRFGDAARLSWYELSASPIQAGQTLTVTTHWDNVRRSDLLVKVAIVSPATHLFGVPQAITVGQESLAGDGVQHALRIPAGTVRGIDLLTVQVYSPEGEIRPITARGETLGTTYLLPVRVSGDNRASGEEPILQQFGERIALSKAQTIQSLADTLDVTLTWRVSASPQQNYKTALRLKDPSGWEVARLDTQPGYGFYPTSMWRPGELVNDRYTLSLDDGTPPGTRYSLDVTLYEAASLRPIGTTTIPNVVVSRPTIRESGKVLSWFGPAIALSEAQVLKEELKQGEELALSLKWVAASQVDRDYECRVALLGQSGTPAFSQTLPLAAEYPTVLWQQNAVVAGHYRLRLPPDFPAGQYTLAVTVVEAQSGQEAGQFLLPTPVHVGETTRNFAAPTMQQVVGADFGGQLRLLGYDMQRTEKELLLTLHWQALSEMGIDYKVFVHLFDPATERIAAQQDVPAGGEAYPTTRWVPNEVISDRIGIPLLGVQAGTYHLAVGVYHPAGRLPVVAPQAFTVSADRLLLSEALQMP